jgi:hypothetical protein
MLLMPKVETILDALYYQNNPLSRKDLINAKIRLASGIDMKMVCIECGVTEDALLSQIRLLDSSSIGQAINRKIELMQQVAEVHAELEEFEDGLSRQIGDKSLNDIDEVLSLPTEYDRKRDEAVNIIKDTYLIAAKFHKNMLIKTVNRERKGEYLPHEAVAVTKMQGLSLPEIIDKLRCSEDIQKDQAIEHAPKIMFSIECVSAPQNNDTQD